MADVSKINGYNLKDASAREELNNKADKEHTHEEYVESSALESKQDKLVSGSNIKTINGKSVLGSGDITITGGNGDIDLSGYATKEDLDAKADEEHTHNEYAQSSALNLKQDKLVSGTSIKTINGQSVLGSGNITIEGGSSEVTEQASCSRGDSFIHFSFDDVTNIITTLAAGNLNSIYDNSFLAMLRDMHDTYGFVFSLYIQSAPNSISTKHQTELQEASSWLKWGIHALNGGNYQSSSYNQGKTDWNKMVDIILELTGTHNAIDRIPRLHQFYGSKEALQGMRDAKLGAKGFLSTDDTRNAYYLPTEKLNYLYEGENDHLTDFENSLVFYRTDLRLDWFSGAGFTYNAAAGMSSHAPTDNSDILGELEKRFKDALYINTWDCYVIFTHEWQPQSAIENALVAIGNFAKNHNIPFDFPQNHQASISQGDIQYVADGNSDIEVDSALSGTSENPVQNKVVNSSISSLINMDATLTSYVNSLEERIIALETINGATLYNVSNILTNVTNSNAITSIAKGKSYSATLTANNETGEIASVIVSMGGVDITNDVYDNGSITIESVTGDIVITATATVEGSETVEKITFTDGKTMNVVDVFKSITWANGNSNNGQTSNIECGYPIVTSVGRAAGNQALKVNGGETITFTQATTGLAYSVIALVNSDALTTSGGNDFIAKSWLTTSVTLPSDTRYVLFAFKNGNGASNFTEEQLALLSDALTIE